MDLLSTQSPRYMATGLCVVDEIGIHSLGCYCVSRGNGVIGVIWTKEGNFLDEPSGYCIHLVALFVVYMFVVVYSMYSSQQCCTWNVST
jgi:hypothetical protein